MQYLGLTVSASEISVSTKTVEAVRDASAYDAQGSSGFCAIPELLCQVNPSFQRPYGTIDGHTAEVPATKGHADAY
jgi:hypothetical protein